MAKRRFAIADLHLGHQGILTYANRPFKDTLQMACDIVYNYNQVVRPEDTVYFLGDVAWRKRDLNFLECMNGRKILIKGNHDMCKPKDYLKYFKDIRACHVLGDNILTHVPIHPDCFEKRFKKNYHGHLHEKIIEASNTDEYLCEMPDERYINCCVERTNYTPILIEE